MRLWSTLQASADELLGPNAISARLANTLILMILLICAGVRLATIGVPSLDRTSWKEIDYLEISQSYLEHGFNFFRPELWWPAEEPRATAMEFPLVPYLAAILYRVFGYSALSARGLTLISFLVVSLYTYRLARRELGPLVGVGAGMASAIMPLYHDFGRALFSEPEMIAANVMAVYHFAEWVEFRRRRDWIAAMIAFSLAVALKLTPLYLLIPLGWIALRAYQLQWRRYLDLLLLIVCAAILPMIWYANAYYLSCTVLDVFGIYKGKYGGHDKLQTFSLLTDPAWYEAIKERLIWHILGGRIGELLFLVGVGAAIVLRRGGLYLAYLAALWAFFGIVAEGNIDAPYRQLESIPVLATFTAIGALVIAAPIYFACKAMTGRGGSQPIAATEAATVSGHVCLAMVLLVTATISVKKLDRILERNTLAAVDINRWRLAAAIRESVPADGKLVVAGEYSIHKGGNDFSPVLYHYSGRQGWTLEPEDWNLETIERLKQRGATHFVAIQMSREPASLPFLDAMRRHYRVLKDADEQMLIDLRPSG